MQNETAARGGNEEGDKAHDYLSDSSGLAAHSTSFLSYFFSLLSHSLSLSSMIPRQGNGSEVELLWVGLMCSGEDMVRSRGWGWVCGWRKMKLHPAEMEMLVFKVGRGSFGGCMAISEIVEVILVFSHFIRIST